MAVSGAISGNDGSFTWNNGRTEGTDQTSGVTTNMSSAELAVSADGTQAASATHSGPNRQAIVAAALSPVTDSVTEIVWQAVEPKGGSSVQRGNESFSAGVAQRAVPISTIVPERSIVLSAIQPVGGQNMGRSPYASDDIIGVCSVSMILTAHKS